MAADDLTIKATLRDEMSRPLREVRDELKEVRQEADRLGRTDAAAGLNRVDRQLGRVRRSATGAGAGLRNTGRQSDGLRRALRGLDTQTRTVSATLGRSLAGAGKAAALGLGAATAAAGVFGLRTAASFEQSRVAFSTLLGSVEKGEALFGRVTELARVTPFQVPQLAQATQTLLNFGFAGEEVEDTLRAIVDAASASGPRAAENVGLIAIALGQVRTNGRVLGQELRQLVNAGVPAYELLGHAAGTSAAAVRDMAEAGQEFPADLFIKAFTELEGPMQKFEGLAIRQSETLMGLWSTLLDTITLGLEKTAKPLMEELKTSMPAISEGVGTILATVGPPLVRLFATIAEAAVKILPAVAPLLGAIAEGIAGILTGLEPFFNELARMGPDIAKAMSDLFVALGPMVPVLGELLVAAGPLAITFLELATTLTNLFLPIVEPILRFLADATQESGQFRFILAALLMTLLGYRALAGIAGAVSTFAGAIRSLGPAATTAKVGMDAAATSASRLTTLAQGAGRAVAGAAGGFALGTGIGAATSGGMSEKNAGKWQRDLGVTGSIVGTGAMFGPIGILGGLAGGVGYLGFRNIQEALGDTASPHRRHARSMASHAAIAGGLPGRYRVTSGLRSWGVGSDSDHRAGAALDIVGPSLHTYAARLRKAGGWASVHDSGSGRHLHAVYGDTPTPRRGVVAAAGEGELGRGPVTVNVYYPTRELDVEKAVERALRRDERDRVERRRRG